MEESWIQSIQISSQSTCSEAPARYRMYRVLRPGVKKVASFSRGRELPMRQDIMCTGGHRMGRMHSSIQYHLPSIPYMSHRDLSRMLTFE